MALVVWNDKLSIGVRSIDDQHQKMVDHLNQLHDAMVEGHGAAIVGPALKGLIDCTANHFKYEEELFARTGYADGVAHKKEHIDLVNRVLEVQKTYNKKGPKVLTVHVRNFLKDWLTGHIQGSDQKYVAHLKAKGVR